MFNARDYAEIEITLRQLHHLQRRNVVEQTKLAWGRTLGVHMLKMILDKQRECAPEGGWMFTGRTADLVAACELMLDDEATYIANAELTMARRNDDA